MDLKPLPTEQDLQAQAQAMTNDAVERQMGALACAKTAAEARVAVYRQQCANLQAVCNSLEGELATAAETIAKLQPPAAPPAEEGEEAEQGAGGLAPPPPPADAETARGTAAVLATG